MREPFTHAHHTDKITFSQLPNGRDELSPMDKSIAPKSSFTNPRDGSKNTQEGDWSFSGVLLGQSLHSHHPPSP